MIVETRTRDRPTLAPSPADAAALAAAARGPAAATRSWLNVAKTSSARGSMLCLLGRWRTGGYYDLDRPIDSIEGPGDLVLFKGWRYLSSPIVVWCLCACLRSSLDRLSEQPLQALEVQTIYLFGSETGRVLSRVRLTFELSLDYVSHFACLWCWLSIPNARSLVGKAARESRRVAVADGGLNMIEAEPSKGCWFG